MTGRTLTHKQARTLAQSAWWAGVKAVNGYSLVLDELKNNHHPPVTHVFAIGKAAAAMMSAASDYYANTFKGLVITKYGHIEKNYKASSSIQVIEAAHPVPDHNSLIAGNLALDFVRSLGEHDSLLVLVSGGASALAEKLKANMSLSDLQVFNNRLLSEDKTIEQINAARSQISLIKKGQLLNQCKAGSILTLAISDVSGDDVLIIGSGIGACDLPCSKARVIGSNRIARDAICKYLEKSGIEVIHNQESLYGELFDVSKDVVALLTAGPAGGYILGGETVVELPVNPGHGGRNQSLALAIAKHLKNHPGIIVLVAGSDGTDGPTEVAGGLVDSQTFEESGAAQLALDQANASVYLSSRNALFVSGPTGTNVMDLLVAIKY